MTKSVWIITVILLSAAAAGFAVWSVWECCSINSSATSADGAKTSIFRVEGMTCGGCETGVKMAVKKIDGVQRVVASYEEKKAVVTYDPAKTNPEQIKAAIEKLGYKAELQKSEGSQK